MSEWFQTEWAAVWLHLQNTIVIVPLCVSQQNMASLKDRSVSMRVCDTQSLPTRHPQRYNTDVLRLLLLWLTPFELKLLVSLHHLCGHHALNLQGERRRERNKQAVARFYRARLQGTTTHSGSEFHFQNNVRFKFPWRSQLATFLQIKSSVLAEKTMKLPGFIQGAYTAPVKVKHTHTVYIKWINTKRIWFRPTLHVMR